MPEGSTKLIQAPDVCWNKSFKAACSKKEWLTAGYRGNLRRNSCRKFESILEKNHFAVDSRFSGGVTDKKLSQAASWAFPWMGRKATWFTSSGNDSLMAVDDWCFYRSCKFWVNKTQIPLNVPVPIQRKHIRHYIFWIRIIKRTVTWNWVNYVHFISL